MNTEEMIAKAICYGFERGRYRHETNSDGIDCEQEKKYAARYVGNEWTDWRPEVKHCMRVAFGHEQLCGEYHRVEVKIK
jgi:hypothetical protein